MAGREQPSLAGAGAGVARATMRLPRLHVGPSTGPTLSQVQLQLAGGRWQAAGGGYLLAASAPFSRPRLSLRPLSPLSLCGLPASRFPARQTSPTHRGPTHLQRSRTPAPPCPHSCCCFPALGFQAPQAQAACPLSQDSIIRRKHAGEIHIRRVNTATTTTVASCHIAHALKQTSVPCMPACQDETETGRPTLSRD